MTIPRETVSLVSPRATTFPQTPFLTGRERVKSKHNSLNLWETIQKLEFSTHA